MPRHSRLNRSTPATSVRSLRLEPLEERRVLAATPEMLTDVGSTPHSGDSNPSGFVQVGELTYFSTKPSSFDPQQTWVTDGTTNATRLLSEVLPGNLLVGSVVGNVAGTLYFSASDSGTFGYRLWKWDGFGHDPMPVLNADGSRIAASTSMLNIDGVWYFGGSLQGLQSEIWRTDGTEAGTYRVKSIRSSFSPGAIGQSLFNVNGELFFFADDGVHGNELWKSDGTETGTVMVKDVNPGAAPGVDASMSRTQVAVVGDRLYFMARDQQSDWELWRSDGSESGTYRVKDIRAGANGSIPSHLTNVGGTLYFSATDDMSSTSKLWKSDGTDAGTVRVLAASSVLLSNPFDLTEMNGKLYFGAAGDLWRSDGTQAGTQRILQSGIPQLPVGIPTPYDGSSDVVPGNRDNIVNLNGTLYFVGNGSGYKGLWKYDDQSTGATLVLSKGNAGHGSTYTFNTLQYLTIAGDKLFFAGESTPHGNEPWISDGTTAGTVLLKDVTGASTSSGVSFLTNVDGTLFFSARTGNYSGTVGAGWWTSDGSLVGTTSFAAITGATNNYSLLGAAGGLLYYKAKGISGSDWELWRTDGTAAGTYRAKDIHPGARGGLSSAFTRSIEMNGELYFVASDGVHGFELWRSDGTEDGTTMVADVFPGGMDGLSNVNRTPMAKVGGTLYFVANDGASGNALWKTDGTAAGTALVRTFNTWTPRNLFNVNGTLFFGAGHDDSGLELWKSDGTEAGTVLVKDIAPGNSLASLDEPGFANIGDTIYFVANDGTTGFELWKSDGTEAGTVLVKDILGDGSGLPAAGGLSFTVVGNAVYFYANDGVHGRELWKSDGTEAGTALVKDVWAGASSSKTGAFADPVNVSGLLYFSATDGTSAVSLWRTDGTEAGTKLVSLTTGGIDSSIGLFTNVNGRLFFVDSDLAHGTELWVLSPDEAAMEQGDYDQNGVTDGADFLKWQRAFGSADVTNDGDGDETVGSGDLDVWQASFGSPEPLLQEQAVAAAVAALGTKEEVVDDYQIATAPVIRAEIIPPLAPPFKGGGFELQREGVRDALFAAGDFSRLFGFDGGHGRDGEEMSRRRWRRQ
jgi:ELWxxDGT repeat protein